jgi:16S rRNA (guanine527-N7)-methyltransferase
MTTLTNKQIEAALLAYGVKPDAGTSDKIQLYLSLLLKWNRTVSLTTVANPVEIIKFHFGESLFALSSINFAQSRLADVGSGAGFPGIPLAMAVPSLNLTLIESNAKKCAFLLEVARELQLANVRLFRGRADHLPKDTPQFDFITSRAAGHLDDLLGWTKRHLTPAGKLVLWLGGEGVRGISLLPDWKWDKSALIPASKRRFLLVGSPID